MLKTLLLDNPTEAIEFFKKHSLRDAISLISKIRYYIVYRGTSYFFTPDSRIEEAIRTAGLEASLESSLDTTKLMQQLSMAESRIFRVAYFLNLEKNSTLPANLTWAM